MKTVCLSSLRVEYTVYIKTQGEEKYTHINTHTVHSCKKKKTTKKKKKKTEDQHLQKRKSITELKKNQQPYRNSRNYINQRHHQKSLESLWEPIY